ncbi:GAF domain protein [Kutzneria sp. CA-103260]|nr:GAF domain protein [Kutzneria sp. CA-103260]
MPLSTISRLVREMGAATSTTGAVDIAAELGHRLLRMPVGILLQDGRDDPIIAGSPVDERYTLLYRAQTRNGPWQESRRTGQPVSCSYRTAQSRDWTSLATAMGYGGIAAIDTMPLHACGRAVGMLSVFRFDNATAAVLRARNMVRDFIEIGLTTLWLRHEVSAIAERAEPVLKSLRAGNHIALATGIMAGRHGLSPPQAALALNEHARRRELPLDKAARLIVYGLVSAHELDLAVSNAIGRSGGDHYAGRDP